MSSRTLDLRKVFGMIVTYNYVTEAVVSPHHAFTITAELFPGGASVLHLHPHQEEIYEVQEGELEIFLDGEWKILKAGEKINIPKGSPHAFRNSGSEKVVALNIHDPGLRFGEMLETIQQYISQKKITGSKGFRNRAHLAAIMLNYEDVLVTVKPTPSQLRLVARAGRAFGYK